MELIPVYQKKVSFKNRSENERKSLVDKLIGKNAKLSNLKKNYILKDKQIQEFLKRSIKKIYILKKFVMISKTIFF